MINALGQPQTVVVFGGTSEIGLCIAEQYADVRPRVVLAARPTPRRDEAAERLHGQGFAVETVDFDALDTASHPAVVEQIAAAHEIDLAVVAFGVLGDEEEAWQDHAAAVHHAQVNYTAAVSVGVCLASVVRRQGHGTIVALSSVAGERVRRSNFVYGSSKAGMDGFYLGLGEALAPEGGHVVVVRPGFVRTKMTEGRDEAPLSVDPVEVARATVEAVRTGRELIWVPAAFRPVMSVLRHVPRRVFRHLPV